MEIIKSPKARKNAKPEAPSSLRMELFSPGMTPLHRAGLGGLACTLKYIEHQYHQGVLADKDVPGGPWGAAGPPWEISPQFVTLQFGKPDTAAEYLKRLFGLGFALRGRMIYLPGQHTVSPSDAVLAELQHAVQLTFLQHGPSCGSRTGESTISYEVDGRALTITHDAFTSYKHQGWYWLERDEKERVTDASGKALTRKTGNRVKIHREFDAVSAGGRLSLRSHPIDNAIAPGAMVRHDRFKNSAITETESTLICAHFALVGCIALSVNRGVGVLLIPEVASLLDFCTTRPWITPTSVRDCRITCAADAALQAQVRLLSKRVIGMHNLPAIHAITFRPTAWARQQKSRVSTILVPPSDEDRLRRFEIAMAELPPKVLSRTIKETAGRGRNKVATERTESFWVDSVIRPLIADNLASGRPWYAGFARLMTALDSNNKPIREKVRFEMKGLNAMVNNKAMWDSVSEEVVVRAVHEALRSRYGRIADENKGKSVAMKKRWAGEYDRWRLAFAGAKTADQFRNALCDLFSRAGGNSVLREKWTAVLPMLNEKQWQQARDLALLALPSYAGQVGGGSDNEANKD